MRRKGLVFEVFLGMQKMKIKSSTGLALQEPSRSSR